MQDATRYRLCLTALVNLTGTDLLVQLWPVALRLARLVHAFRNGRLTPETTFQFESAVENLLREMGRRIVRWTLNHLEPTDRGAMPSQLIWDNEYYRRGYPSPLRNLNCLFGPISLRRFYYQPVESLVRCLCPLEVQLGIVAGVATPALADHIARLSVDLTQQQTLDRLAERGIHWGARTLRKLTTAVAAAMQEHRHEAQVEQLLSWLQQATESVGPRCFTMSVGRDGVMVPIVKNKKYKEAAAATVSIMDRLGRRIGTVYLGQMPEEGQVTLSQQLTLLLQEVLRRWSGEAPRLVYVTDCGSHATDYFEKVLQWMTHPNRPAELLKWEWIVDYYHACQYISKLAEVIFGPGREASAWAAKQRKVLKTKSNGCLRVLRSAGALLSIRGLVGSEADYHTAYNYLRNRVSKMDYRNYRRRRLPIGSGVTEAACKIVFTQRFKLSGMKWSIEGGRTILALRVIALSKIWNQVRQAALRSHIMPSPVTPTLTSKHIAKKAHKIAA